ncbi:UNVERIFIED_ORG: hypothetical protein ABIB63_002649 [Xanthomonas axonopodis]
MEIIHATRLLALTLQIRANALRHTEQLHRLIEQMRAQVIPQSGTGAIALAPTVAHLRAIAIEVRMKFHHLAQLAFFDQPAHGEKVRIPAAILEHADDASRRIGGSDHLLRLRRIQCKWLVHQHMLAGGQGLQREGGMGVVRGGQHYGIQCGIGQRTVEVGHHGDAGKIGLRLLWLGRHHAVQLQAGGACDQRCMKGAADIAVADDGQIELFRH